MSFSQFAHSTRGKTEHWIGLPLDRLHWAITVFTTVVAVCMCVLFQRWRQKHTSIFTFLGGLGMLFFNRRRLQETKELFLRTPKRRKEALGPKHISTLSTLNNLGILYSQQGKMKEAEQMYMQALKLKEKALGPKHASTLVTVNNLGNLYFDNGKMGEAKEMYVRAFLGRK